MSDLEVLVKIASIGKDLGIVGLLMYIVYGALRLTWVPGAYYRDQIARAEKAEAAAERAHDAADRATRVSEQLADMMQGARR